MPIPKVKGRQPALWRTAAPSVLAPESALGSLLSVALSSAQVMCRFSPVMDVRQPLSRRPCFAVVAPELPPASDHAVRGSWAPYHSACRLERGSRSPSADAHGCSAPQILAKGRCSDCSRAVAGSTGEFVGRCALQWCGCRRRIFPGIAPVSKYLLTAPRPVSTFVVREETETGSAGP